MPFTPPSTPHDIDLVKLHAVIVNNANAEAKQRLGKLEAQALGSYNNFRSEYMSLMRRQNTEDRKLIVPLLVSTKAKLKEADDKLHQIRKDMQKDHLTSYLLEALPILNCMHAVNAKIAQCSRDGTDDSDLRMEKTHIIEKYVRKFYPSMLKRVRKHDRAQDVRTANTGSSKCCNAPIIQTDESSLLCHKCGYVIAEAAIIQSNPRKNLSYSRQMSASKSYSYRRSNHLRELLRSILGRSMISLSDEDFTRVRDEVKKHTIKRSRIDGYYVRKILKKLSLNSHYEQSISIARVLNPEVDIIKISPQYEERLILQFISLEEPFEKVRDKVDKTRRNFLSYSYVFFRLNQLNGRDDLNRGIKLLKSVTLVNRQDAFWKAICEELKWNYLGNSASV